MAWWAADVVGMICASGGDKSQLRENGRWENVYNKHNVLGGEGEGLNSSQMAKDCHLLSIYYVANPHGCKHIIATNSSEVNNNHYYIPFTDEWTEALHVNNLPRHTVISEWYPEPLHLISLPKSVSLREGKRKEVFHLRVFP